MKLFLVAAGAIVVLAVAAMRMWVGVDSRDPSSTGWFGGTRKTGDDLGAA
jgi:hypothetical protein